MTAIGLAALVAGCAVEPVACNSCGCAYDSYAVGGVRRVSDPRCVAPEPRYAIAVTKPAPCNEYPVTYRVQVPDTDPRVRNVERVVYRYAFEPVE